MDKTMRMLLSIIAIVLLIITLCIARFLDQNGIAYERDTLYTEPSKVYYDKENHENNMGSEMQNADYQIDDVTTGRFIVFSDVHYNESELSIEESDTRMQLLVDSINAEHNNKPIDFCVFNGDIAIGYSKSSIETFAEKWIDKFQMPVFWFPGDHDDVSDETWTHIFNNHRQATLENDKFYFIWLDVYSDASDDGEESSGIRVSKTIDTNWVIKEIAKAGKKPIILMTHYIYSATWYPDLATLLDKYPQIVAVISSHSHENSVSKIGKYNRPLVNTGNFSYPNSADWGKKGENNQNLWGFANFEIENDYLYHWYIQPANNYKDISVNLPYTEGEKNLIFKIK